MIPRIDFYLIPETNAIDGLRFTCRVVEKAYEQNHQVFIYAENLAQAHQLNDSLWTFKDISFIPHQLIGEPSDIIPPIQIGSDNALPDHRDILINLHPQLPVFFDQFDRVIEIVLNQTNAEEISRQHTLLFQEKKLPVNTFNLREKNNA